MTEEKEGPREDWAARRPPGQLLYASKYDTEVLLNHTERQLVRGSDQKNGGRPTWRSPQKEERAHDGLKAKAGVVSRGDIRQL